MFARKTGGMETMADTATSVARCEQNPFALVYDGAIATNEPGKANIHPVSHNLNGLDVAATVQTPPGCDPDGKHAAAVVAYPNGGVKEQVSGLSQSRVHIRSGLPSGEAGCGTTSPPA